MRSAFNSALTLLSSSICYLIAINLSSCPNSCQVHGLLPDLLSQSLAAYSHLSSCILVYGPRDPSILFYVLFPNLIDLPNPRVTYDSKSLAAPLCSLMKFLRRGKLYAAS